MFYPILSRKTRDFEESYKPFTNGLRTNQRRVIKIRQKNDPHPRSIRLYPKCCGLVLPCSNLPNPMKMFVTLYPKSYGLVFLCLYDHIHKNQRDKGMTKRLESKTSPTFLSFPWSDEERSSSVSLLLSCLPRTSVPRARFALRSLGLRYSR